MYYKYIFFNLNKITEFSFDILYFYNKSYKEYNITIYNNCIINIL